MTGKETLDYKNFYYPPGGILLWILILLEILTFGIALIVLVVFSREDPALYHRSKEILNVNFGATNTVFLLTSGFFMASSIHRFHRGDLPKAARFLRLAALGGLLFLTLKGFEYYEKIEEGYTLGYNTFFTFYWLLTGFHVIHVLVGLVILSFMHHSLSQKTAVREDMEAGATFWHMCDLIWLLLFPVLYLIL